MTDLPVASIPPPNTFNFAADVVDKWAENPELKAMIWTDTADPQGSRRDLTYRYFSERSHHVARWMSEDLEIKQGDRMVIMLPRVPEWWEIILGAIRMGAVVIPCTTLLTPRDMEYRLQASRAKVFISEETGAEKFHRIGSRHQVGTKIVLYLQKNGRRNLDGWNDYHRGIASIKQVRFNTIRSNAKTPCMIYFTSGTSGPPKMVLHNAVSYPLGSFITGEYWYRLSPGKVLWFFSDLGWAKAAWATFSSWSKGATLFIQDDRGPFNPGRFIRNLHEFEIMTLCVPPTMYRQCVLREWAEMIRQNRPRALERCMAAGEALNRDVIDAWRKLTGLTICEAYGQTETILLCGNPGTFPVRPGSMGKPPPGIQLGIIDEAGKELPPGTEGIIAVVISTPTAPQPSPWVFDGYLREDGSISRPEILDPTTGRRWFSTGDRAICDEDGYFWYVGRADDVISTAGYRVGPFELESVIREHEAVSESAVVASPDPQRGEIIKAFIVLKENYRHSRRDPEQLAQEIQEFVARNTAPYKKPRAIEFVDLLPKTVSGKIRHAELRAREREKARQKQVKNRTKL